MKKILLIIIPIMLLTGCKSVRDVSSESVYKENSENVTIPDKIVSEQDVSENVQEEVQMITVAENKKLPSQISDGSPSPTSSPPVGKTEKNKKNNPVSNQPSSTSETLTENQSLTVPEVPAENKPKETVPEAATQADAGWIAGRIEELLNEERTAIGVHNRSLLPGLNKIAEYRSVQIISNFSHNWVDENGKQHVGSVFAAIYFKYGNHTKTDETRYDVNTGTVYKTGNILEYYSYGGAENIGKGGIGCQTKEELSQYIVYGFKNSTAHWKSLMEASNNFDGVGITIQDGRWYISINTSVNNYG